MVDGAEQVECACLLREAGLRVSSDKERALHLLFVCTGNICRSPTAERLALAYAHRAGIPGITASSAGTRAVVGHPIHDDAANVIKKLGGDASDFAARRLTLRSAAAADLILALTTAHRDVVLELAPQKLHRTFTLTEASRMASELNANSLRDLAALRSQLSAGEITDVRDPIGQSPEVFARVGSQIAELLPPILELCGRATASEI